MRQVVLPVVFVFMLPVFVVADEITVACWNVENLFDTHKDTNNSGEYVPTADQLKLKMGKIAEVIKHLKADIVGLTEVENQGVLRTLIRDHLASERYDYYQLIEQTDPRGIDVAIIAKLPFTGYSFEVPGHTRGILACRFAVRGEPFYVLVNHWKSRIGGGDEIRMACAKRTLELVTGVIPRHEGRAVPVLIMGDFNDDDSDEPVLALEKGGLTNTLKRLDPSRRWSYPWWDKANNKVHYHGFDHIFCNDAMTDQKGIDLIPNSAAVVRPNFMLRKRRFADAERDWVDNSYSEHIGYSDHLPVMAKLKTIALDPSVK